ncbi:hypothetical protein EYF80_027950 [Liparis tanakae]|uniref:Uncharacterized protein n=1 Tax=Liparis tanakae TaxID=230148 RepID=A0A4Z2H9X7_9TELE|nr:hypothetical protein EYF80_027950 [Liparis tanakae]
MLLTVVTVNIGCLICLEDKVHYDIIRHIGHVAGQRLRFPSPRLGPSVSAGSRVVEQSVSQSEKQEGSEAGVTPGCSLSRFPPGPGPYSTLETGKRGGASRPIKRSVHNGPHYGFKGAQSHPTPAIPPPGPRNHSSVLLFPLLLLFYDDISFLHPFSSSSSPNPCCLLTNTNSPTSISISISSRPLF